jgi:hypothetical protein
MKKLAVLFISLVLFSCTEESVNQSSQEVLITGYKIDINSSPGYHFKTIGSLVNNKLFSETYENILNGEVQVPITEQIFFYNANGTVNHYRDGFNRMVYLYYDDSQNLIGAELTINNLNAVYYRFRHLSANRVLFERTDSAYDDPNAVAYCTIVLQFNNNNDVISAGIDTNSDDIADYNINTFQYANDNLISAVFWDGNIVNYNYSDIIDNFSYLREISIGKKTRRIISGDCYHVLYSSDFFYRNLRVSRNILEDEAALSTFQILPNNFYELRTEINNGQTTTTQFFFE